MSAELHVEVSLFTTDRRWLVAEFTEWDGPIPAVGDSVLLDLNGCWCGESMHLLDIKRRLWDWSDSDEDDGASPDVCLHAAFGDHDEHYRRSLANLAASAACSLITTDRRPLDTPTAKGL